MKKIFCVVLCIAVFVLIFPVNAEAVSAKSAVVICGDTGEILYSKNCDTRMPMASTTKIMTALLLCENGDLEREITATKEMVAVEGSSMGLLAGDTVSLRALLYGMLLASGNDAANTTAYVLAGSINGFAQMMNKRAKELGLKNTNFVTPSGLDADNHYTTAYDLAILAKAALSNQDFASAAASEYETLYYGNPPYRRTLKNHNKLLNNFNGAVGVKTGFTKKSGRCLVSAAKRDGRYVIAVTLNAPDDWNDHKYLLEYGLSRVNSVTPAISDIPPIHVINANIETVNCIYNEISLSVSDETSIETKVYAPRFLYAPLNKGQTIGKIVYYIGNEAIYEAPLTVDSDVAEEKYDFYIAFKSLLKYIFSIF